MPALALSLEEVLGELRQDPDFASFPDWWQQQIAAEVLEHGLEAALQRNADWAAQNPNDPSAAALIRWADRGQQIVSTGGQPLEQGILNTALPGLLNQISGDTGRQQQVTELTGQTNAAYGNLGAILGQSAMRFDGNAYLQQNPDVAEAFAADPRGMSVDDYAQWHFNTFGRNEGRKDTTTSTLLDRQRSNVDTTVNSIIDASRGNATASNAALTTMTGEQLGNLEASIATQKAALEQQVRELQGSAGEAANARRAALAQQLAELTAAQRPVSEARIRAAESEVTGINLGLESTRDQIAADAAREGFVGPSSFTDAALARSAIDARQGAARVAGGARVANAVDERGIGTYGANQGYSISDVFAGERQRASDFGSAGRAALTGFGAEAGRTINDAGATGRYNIATTGSREEQAARTAGAGQKSAYFDQLFPSAVNSAQLLTQLPAAQAGALTSLIPLGTAGTNNALNTLNWWSTNATPPSSTAVTTTASNAGNQFGQLGAGLVGAGFQMSNPNWWKTPTPTTAPTTTNRSTATSPNNTWGTWGGSNNKFN